MDNQEKGWSYMQPGFHVARLNEHNTKEVCFAKAWEKQNDDIKATMSKPTLSVLIPDCTQRDAQVAATIIQWLGSNVGMGFLHEVFREIETQDI